MRYSSNRQKVLRFCGAMVSPGPTLSASRAAASADQPFWPKEAASRRGLSLARPRRQVARPFLSCHFPGEPASSQEWANRRRGHHTRPPLRSQSERYTSPPRRRGQPVRQQNCSRGPQPMRRGNVRGSRRPEAPENRRELGAEKERAAVGNPECSPIARLFPDSDQLLERGLNVVMCTRDARALTVVQPQEVSKYVGASCLEIGSQYKLTTVSVIVGKRPGTS